MAKHTDHGWFAAVSFSLAVGLSPATIASVSASPVPPVNETLLRWNTIAVDASGLDHTPPGPGEDREFAEQPGPGRASRAMAIVHIAIFDAMNAIAPRYRGYTGLGAVRHRASVQAAIARAAHDTLTTLFPAQSAVFHARFAEDVAKLPRTTQTLTGLLVGRRAARAILSLRADDGSAHDEPLLGVDYYPGDRPGDWGQDPVSLLPVALGAFWSGVDPFVMRRANQFRVPPPPPLDSAAYTSAFDEVASVGGDGVVTPTDRTAEQTHIGIYWAYDGTPSLCAPPRLYNQIAVLIAGQKGTRDLELARLLALVHTAMADAGIAIWESKYFYGFWRPVTAIRAAEADGNPYTSGDPTFSPLGAPASNLAAPNFTPPFPAYPSGHAGFGGALFETLRLFYRTDAIPFTFVSDEFDGVTEDNTGTVRPLMPRSFTSLSQAEEENGQSRMYLGIHWAFDKTEGIAQGRRVARYVFANAFRPRR